MNIVETSRHLKIGNIYFLRDLGFLNIIKLEYFWKQYNVCMRKVARIIFNNKRDKCQLMLYIVTAVKKWRCIYEITKYQHK